VAGGRPGGEPPFEHEDDDDDDDEDEDEDDDDDDSDGERLSRPTIGSDDDDDDTDEALFLWCWPPLLPSVLPFGGAGASAPI